MTESVKDRRAKILIFVLTPEIAERAPEVCDNELRLAVVLARDACRISQLHETLAKVAGHRARVHPIPCRKIDIAPIDCRPGPRHPYTARAST